MRRTVPAALAAALAVVPTGVAAWNTMHAASPTATATAAATSGRHATPTPTATPKGSKHAKAKSKKKTVARAHPTATAVPQQTETVDGPSVNMDWGPVQVTIVVKGKKLVDVKATAPMERARSNFINSQALPWLRQEVLQAQSANVDMIGGATLTSQAYLQSLQAALDQAHI
jgi:uncharacterized protein with FMN-binding domain